MKTAATPVHKVKLSNGMIVIAIPSRQAPVVSLQGWIRFGSADESEDVAGIAHLFEHLLFKGTNKRAVGQIASEIEGLGGDLNAYTTYDHTVMHMTLPSRVLNQGLEILADSLLNSTVDPDELGREKPVILEEIKRRNDMPGAIASDLVRSELFRGHTYARPVIGYAKVVEEMPREKILEQYHKHYNANNLFLVVAGDFELDALVKECESLFKTLKSGGVPKARHDAAPLTESVTSIQHHPSPDALLTFGWQAPNGSHDDVPALDALALILGQGDSCRLVKKLIFEDKLVREIGAGYWSPKDAGSFTIGLKGPAGTSKNFAKIVDAIDSCLRPAITEAELDKAKKNLLASATYSKETVDGLAQRFGYYESIAGDWAMDTRFLDQVRELTIADVESARDRYLNWDRCVCGGIVPEKDTIPVFKKPSAPAKAKAKSGADTHGVETFEFNGLKVVVKTLSHLPMFSLRWMGLGGGRCEPSAKAGIGALWSRSVASGARARDGRIWTRDSINEFVDQASSSMNAFHGRNSFGYQLDGLSADFEALADLVLATRHAPTFDPKIVAQEKTHLLNDIRSMKDSPGSVVSQLFMNGMFGKHSYGRPTTGTPESVKKITPRDLASYHARLQKEPQVLCVVGNISAGRVQSYLKSRLAHEKFAKTSSLKKPIKVAAPKKTLSFREKLKKEQTHILLGFSTCNLFNKDRWALLGLSSVLSGQGGRLFLELRDRMSLCYTVSPTHMEGYDAGYFGFYIATSPEKEKTAVEALHREIQRVVQSGVTREEWDKAKRFYSGNHEIEQQRFSTQATGIALDELYGFGYADYFAFDEHFGKVTVEDIHRVAKHYLSTSKNNPLVMAVVGPS